MLFETIHTIIADCRRNFCPISGASTSGVKDLRREFDNALEQSDFVEEVFQHGTVVQTCISI